MQNSPVVKDNTTVFGQLQSKLIVEVIDMTLEQVQPPNERLKQKSLC